MTLLRGTARTMLASYFVISGVRTVVRPEPLVSAAEPMVQAMLPQIQQLAPERIVGWIPTETRTWVRIHAALEVVGGIALATGTGRRLGASLLAASLVPTTIGKYPFWRAPDAATRTAQLEHFAKNISLLGGVLLAARDTEGMPSLRYRARRRGEQLATDTRHAGHRVSAQTKDLTDAAAAEGALLLGTLVGRQRRGATERRATRTERRAERRANRHAAAANAAPPAPAATPPVTPTAPPVTSVPAVATPVTGSHLEV